MQLTIGLCVSLNAHAADTRAFDIAKQRADLALIAFAEQADRTLLFSFDETKNKTANEIRGEYEIVEALELLLADTGLSISMSNQGQLSVAEDVVASEEREVESSKSLLVRIGAVFAGVLFGSNLNAQESAPTYVQDQGVIEEIIVTARRRDETLQDAAIAITAFTEEQINRYQIDGIDQLTQFTPGLVASEGATPGGGSVFLRGIGNGNSNLLTDYAVAINVDGMQVGSFDIRKASVIDIQQIEVLRGPQALFFGKNSPGGVIYYRTADPSDTFEASVSASYESESGDQYVQAIVSGPVSDTVGLRLAARYTEMNGYFNLKTLNAPADPSVIPPSVDGWPDGDDVFVRGTLTAAPTDNFDVRAKLTYTKSDITGGSSTTLQRWDCPFGAPQAQANFPCRKGRDIYVGGAPADIISLVRYHTLDGLGLRENDQVLGTLEMNYRFENGMTLTSLTGTYDVDEKGGQNGSSGARAIGLIPVLDFEFEQFTQELRLSSDWESPLNFTTGLFYESSEVWSDGNFVLDLAAAFGFPLPPFTSDVEQHLEDQEAWSVFVQADWEISEKFKLSGGLRYTDEEKEDTVLLSGVNLTENLADPKLEFDNLSPEITLTYYPNEEWTLYASYKEGFKSGGYDAGFSSGAIAVPGYENTYDEEVITGFEAGAKAVLADNTLALNVAVYSYEYDDLQVSSYDPETITFKVNNAASSDVRGVEVDFNWVPANVAGLTLFGSAAYNDAEYNEFLSACYVGQTPALGCNLTPNTAGAFQQQDLSGERLYNAPEWAASLGFSYERPIADNLLLNFSANAYYSDETYGNQKLDPRDVQDSFTRLNASLALSTLDGRWELALLGRNLTDEITYYSTGPGNFSGGGTGTDAGFPSDRNGFPTRGRELFMRLTYSLN